MKRIDLRPILLFFILFFSFFGTISAAQESSFPQSRWSTSLVFDGGGIWRSRIPVTITNKSESPMKGQPFVIPFEKLQTLSPINIQEIRITNEQGQELLFDVYTATGERLIYGAATKETSLIIPVDCEPNKTSHYFLYFGNEKAEKVPDYLEARSFFFNGDMEIGSGSMPDGWFADSDDDTHHHFWDDNHSNIKPHSGTKMLRTEIKSGTEPSWFGVRQHGFPVTAGVKYRFSAWVRGDNVEGRAGWFLHVGNEQNSQMINNVQNTGGGTFDWKKITIEFTAPKEATLATVGTVLYGSGTAYYDDVSFEKISTETTPDIIVGEVEKIPYKIIEADTVWDETKSPIQCRSLFRLVNDSDKPMNEVPVLLTLRGALAHGLYGGLTNLFVFDKGKRLPATLLDAENSRISVRISVPPKTVKYFPLYYQFDETKNPIHLTLKQSDLGKSTDTAHPEMQAVIDPFADLPNRVQNGGFEDTAEKDGYPTFWQRNENNPPNGVRYSIETSPEIVWFGKSCAKLEVSENVAPNWRGWTQRVAVEPEHAYLVQGWIRTKNAGSVRIHLHFYTADGKLTQNGGMTSINQDVTGTSDWTRVAEVLQTPPDAATMVIHLTTNSSGTIWHDNISVFDGLFAQQTGIESFLSIASDSPLVWQIPALVKVFPQTITTNSILKKDSFQIESARNEKEPLQLAVRSNIARKLNVRITPPKEVALNQFEINVAGYVPVDYPTNYYNTTIAKWFRKTPTAATGCDGWQGRWADPLLPTKTLDLKPEETQAIWITWTIPASAKSGKYSGKIELLDETKVVYENEIGLTVHNFTLPEENHISAIYDVRFGPNGTKYWGKPVEAFNREIVELMTENRLSPDTINIVPKAVWRDGQFIFDWTEFDKAAEWYINERKIRFLYAPMILYSFGWGHPPKKFFDTEPYAGTWPYSGEDFSQIQPEYKKRYQNYVRELWTHLKSKGWAEHFIFYISDEPNFWTKNIIVQMKAVCAMIHEVDPTIPIYSSTWHFVPEWLDSLDVWGIGHYGIVPVETMQKIKDHGSRIWFTTDGMLCLDTPYCAIERLLPYYCFKYGAEAYEFWGVAWLTYNPYEYGSHAYIYQTSTPGEYYWVRYPNGDGYMIYPGKPIDSNKIVSSVRFEQAREGVEDFEYFYLLSQLLKNAKKSGKSGTEITRAEAVLESVKELVDCPSPIGRFSSKILPNPKRLYEVRHQVAEAIEALQR